MPYLRNQLVGSRMPAVLVAEIIEGQLIPSYANDVVGRGRTLVIGVPGAFTPLCAEHHVPGMVWNADQLRKSGFNNLLCIVASDPFATSAWAETMDPERKVRFVSDGNLNLARALGLMSRETELFLGDRSERYLLVVRDGVIETVRVEQKLTDYSCTMPDEFIVAD